MYLGVSTGNGGGGGTAWEGVSAGLEESVPVCAPAFVLDH